MALPSQNHKYADEGCSTLVLVPRKNKSQEIVLEDLARSKLNEKRDEGSVYEGPVSEFVSAKGSISLADDEDHAMSFKGKARFQPKYKKFDDWSSTSNANPEPAVANENKYYSDGPTVSRQGGDKGKSIVGMGEDSSRHIDDESQLCKTLKEDLLEFRCQLGYGCSEYGNDCSKQYAADKEMEEYFGLGQDNYFLSSGYWSKNEGNFSAARSSSTYIGLWSLPHLKA